MEITSSLSIQQEQQQFYNLIIDQYKNNNQSESLPKSVIFIGSSGRGKSTTTQYLINQDNLKVFEEEYEFKFQSLDNTIGNSMTSFTDKVSVHKWHPEKCYILDFPGFDDNRGFFDEFRNSTYYKKYIRQDLEIKIVLFLDEPQFEQKRQESIISNLKKLTKMFLNNITQLQQSLVIVITKCPEDQQLEDYINEFEEILKMSNIGDLISRVLKAVCVREEGQERIALFQVPTSEDCFLENPENIVKAIRNGQFSQNFKVIEENEYETQKWITQMFSDLKSSYQHDYNLQLEKLVNIQSELENDAQDQLSQIEDLVKRVTHVNKIIDDSDEKTINTEEFFKANKELFSQIKQEQLERFERDTQLILILNQLTKENKKYFVSLRNLLVQSTQTLKFQKDGIIDSLINQAQLECINTATLKFVNETKEFLIKSSNVEEKEERTKEFDLFKIKCISWIQVIDSHSELFKYDKPVKESDQQNLPLEIISLVNAINELVKIQAFLNENQKERITNLIDREFIAANKQGLEEFQEKFNQINQNDKSTTQKILQFLQQNKNVLFKIGQGIGMIVQGYQSRNKEPNQQDNS